MKNVLIIGSGISGMSCAIRLAEKGIHVKLASPVPSERAQSVMAAGGINAVTSDCEEGDSVECHIEDTLKGGAMLAGKNAVTGLCSHAEEIIRYLESIGTVFTVDENERPKYRAFGGQTHKRTYYGGASTGKQIVSALIMECRRYEAEGLIERDFGLCFYSALIKEGVCYGALMFDERTNKLLPIYADTVVMAVGGQNSLFGKTTGSTLCDGYAAGKLFLQGVVLKNLEFIQYHPTTLETAQKRMLISEAVRGEGGRLFYEKNGKRVYFMEDKYGPNGNLMTRDVVAAEIDAVEEDVYLDISFLDDKLIDERLPEVRDLCKKYRNIDIKNEPIPVSPSVHFFMGGIAVHINHESSIRNLYAVGECTSIYHGANRLGGNSLLAAMHSGRVAADDISEKNTDQKHPNFDKYISEEQKAFERLLNTKSNFASAHIRDTLAEIMRKNMSILRSEDKLDKGIEDVNYYLSVVEEIKYDSSVLAYMNYSLKGILSLAKAALCCAKARKESRGSHRRTDFPETENDFSYATLIEYDNGNYSVSLERERVYEN
ncbi:MAG: FAD-binding protein [Eubacterium sp.]|nr:FAD-binding protein [Eubacterium sp.]